MTLVKDISPTGIKAMRERISAEVKLARRYNLQGLIKSQWGMEASNAGLNSLASKMFSHAETSFAKRDDHMDAARRCKWELEHVGE